MSERPCLHSVFHAHAGLHPPNFTYTARLLLAPPLLPLPGRLRPLSGTPVAAAGGSLAVTPDLLLKHLDETFATCF
jgi:hypothetical protein